MTRSDSRLQHPGDSGTASHAFSAPVLISNLGYFISHESRHRGSILLTMKQRGHKLDQKASYAIWDREKM